MNLKEKTKMKKEKGITLVALIVTIIVLIILAAVTIYAVVKSNLVDVATKGTENYSVAQVNEVEELDATVQKLEEAVSNIISIGIGNAKEEVPPTIEHIVNPTVENDIGKYVNYKPTIGSYWEDEYETGEAGNINAFAGSSENNEFRTQTNLRWRIWNVTNENLYLISDVPTSTMLYLKGAPGYNNGVTLLDNICSSCYTNDKYKGITVANLKVEDVIAVIVTANTYKDLYGKTQYTYNNTATPYIWWENERDTKTKAIDNKSKAYKLSKKAIEDSASITPYNSSWECSGLSKEETYKDVRYKDLVNQSEYWLSSRWVEPYTNAHCLFGLQFVKQDSLRKRKFVYYSK